MGVVGVQGVTIRKGGVIYARGKAYKGVCIGVYRLIGGNTWVI